MCLFSLHPFRSVSLLVSLHFSFSVLHLIFGVILMAFGDLRRTFYYAFRFAFQCYYCKLFCFTSMMLFVSRSVMQFVSFFNNSSLHFGRLFPMSEDGSVFLWWKTHKLWQRFMKERLYDDVREQLVNQFSVFVSSLIPSYQISYSIFLRCYKCVLSWRDI